jgi:hypothetical protein
MSSLSTQWRIVKNGLLGVLLFASVGCGPEFDPPSKLQSLRILAVKKDDPYLRPTAVAGAVSGSSTDYQPDNVAHMVLAMEDARLEVDKQQPQDEPIQKLWFGGCNNPPRDNYFTCLLSVWLSFKAFKEFGDGKLDPGQTWSINNVPMNFETLQRVTTFLQELFPGYSQSADGSQLIGPNGEVVETQALYAQAAALSIGAGDKFDYTVPATVIEQHTPSTDKDVPPYGLSQVFLAVCDGRIDLSPEWQENVDPLTMLSDATRGFPLTCYERESNKERGPDNFMVSYSNLYVYEELKNINPIIDENKGFSFDGKRVDNTAFCKGEACLSMNEEPSCDAAATPKAKLCKKTGASDCKQHDITPILSDEDVPEIDDIASRVGGGNEQLLEQMWIRYYADKGDIKNDAKRLQDATEGRFAEHDTKWTAPSEGKSDDIVHIWSVVYDNRGGVDWARISVCLEE